MNTLIKDGVPAFPHAQRLWDNDAQSWAVHSVGGMSLRDWLAGQALPRATIGAGGSAPAIAARAYFIADAMLAAREKGQQ